ncbi:MAG: tetratricopeptide repeat protein [bacterium]
MTPIVKTACLVFLTAGLSGVAGTTGTSTNAASLSGELMRDAYASVVEAELARSEQHESEAAAAYRKALQVYGRLQAEYPGWHSAMVNYRVAECQNALAALEAAPGQEPASNDVTNALERLQGLLSELQEVRVVLAVQPESEAKTAQKQLAKEADRLRGQLDGQTRDNKILQRKLSKLESKLNKAGIQESTNTACQAVSALVKAESRRLMQENRTVESIVLLKEAADLMPADSGILIMLGMAQCRIGKFADSILTLSPFDVRHPSHADALLTLGTAYMGLGEIGEARVATEKAIKINPNSAESHYNMAQILLSLLPPEAEGAQQHYLRALELGLNPDPDFENTLRMNLVITKIKKHNAKSRNIKVDRPASRSIPAPAP